MIIRDKAIAALRDFTEGGLSRSISTSKSAALFGAALAVATPALANHSKSPELINGEIYPNAANSTFGVDRPTHKHTGVPELISYNLKQGIADVRTNIPELAEEGGIGPLGGDINRVYYISGHDINRTINAGYGAVINTYMQNTGDKEFQVEPDAIYAIGAKLGSTVNALYAPVSSAINSPLALQSLYYTSGGKKDLSAHTASEYRDVVANAVTENNAAIRMSGDGEFTANVATIIATTDKIEKVNLLEQGRDMQRLAYVAPDRFEAPDYAEGELVWEERWNSPKISGPAS